MRSKPLGLSLTVATVLLLAACTDSPGTDPSASPSPSESQTTPAAVTSLHVAVYGGDQERDLYSDVAGAFVAENPGVEVDLESYSTWAEAEAAYAAAIGSPSMPDVFLIDQSGLTSLVDAGAVTPLGEALVDRGLDFGDGYLRPAVLAFSAQADLQCMPNDVSPYVVFYNPNLIRLRQLARADELPVSAADGWSWEQFTRAARRASRGDAAGVYLPPSFSLFGTLVKAAGGRFLDNSLQPTTIHLSDDASEAAVAQVLGLIRSDRLSLSRAELVEESAAQRFADGRLGLLVGTRDLVPELRDAGVDFDVMPLPKILSTPALTLMNGFCVSTSSQAQDLATDFVAFAVGDDGAAIIARSGGVVPSNTDVLASEAFVVPGVGPENGFVFLDSIQRSSALPATPLWGAAQDAARPYVMRLFYGPSERVPSNLVGLDAKVTAALTPPEAPGS